MIALDSNVEADLTSLKMCTRFIHRSAEFFSAADTTLDTNFSLTFVEVTSTNDISTLYFKGTHLG